MVALVLPKQTFFWSVLNGAWYRLKQVLSICDTRESIPGVLVGVLPTTVTDRQYLPQAQAFGIAVPAIVYNLRAVSGIDSMGP